MEYSTSTKRLVVLGAGASCSYADSPTGCRPPLANQIIPTYFNLDISENRFVLVGNIVNYVWETRGIHPENFPSWKDDIERFLTEIDQEIVFLAPRLKKRKLCEKEFMKINLLQGTYNQLIFLFSSILNEIQNGPVSTPYALLANELKAGDTCITFNWDTLLDRALSSTGNWSPVNGYAIKPQAIFDDGWHPVKNIKNSLNGPFYLKLHGSTNWLTPYHFIDLSTGENRTLSGYATNKLFVYHKATTQYQTYENRYWGPYEPFSYCYYPPDLPCERDDTPKDYINARIVCAPDLPEHAKNTIGEKSVFSMPLIVPPVRDKQYLRYGKIFSDLWGKASDALWKCEELYIIGYSFPQTDYVAKNLFRESLKKNKKLRRVVIWNPYPQNLEQLFVEDFGIDKTKIKVKAEKFDPLKKPNSRILS